LLGVKPVRCVSSDSAPEAGIRLNARRVDFFGGVEPNHDAPPPV
jgi:hypothetical protein